MNPPRVIARFPLHSPLRRGFTLVELALVITLLALVATLTITRLSGVLGKAKTTVAATEMEALRSALVGSPSLCSDLSGIPGFSPAYLRLANLLTPTNLVGTADRWLDGDSRRASRAGFASNVGAVNPNTLYAEFATFTNRTLVPSRGWNGPYIQRYRPIETEASSNALSFPRATDRRFSTDPTFRDRGFFPFSSSSYSPYGLPGEPTMGDPWGNPYVLQVPPSDAFESPSETPESTRFLYARIVSAGPDGILSTPCFNPANPEARRNARLAGRRAHDTTPRGDDLVLFLHRADLYEE